MPSAAPSVAYDAVVIGGGFYGTRLALAMRRRAERVLLAERGSRLLGRASLRNQARVHNGYHYPRSILTSLRSRLNYSRFLDDYGDCADRSFPHYYAVARGMSKITAGQFTEFCRRIGAPLTPAPAAVTRLFDQSRIESVFEVQECAFDADKLRARMAADLAAAGVEVLLDTEALSLTRSAWGGDMVEVRIRHDGEERNVRSELVLNCTYSRLNHLLARSGAASIPAKHELTEMALVEPPAALAGAAVTVMDGPFFSLMPYPSRGLFTLSHVRYTPHCSWLDSAERQPIDGDETLANRETHFVHMVRDAERYLPAMRATRQVDSIWEIKTIMPRSEQDDSRPILLRRSDELPACVTVLGAKLDSVYDVEDALDRLMVSV